MSKSSKMTKLSPLLFWALILVIIIGLTVAWFTNSQRVGTNRVETQTGEDDIKLYVSSQGDSSFVEGESADITQVSQGELTNLMPVSTADLTTFVTASQTDNGVATAFTEDADGQYYYHGRVYIKAVKTKVQEGQTLDLYLDTAESAPVVANSGDESILSAARLGLTFDEANPVIMSLTQTNLTGDEQTGTMVNGSTLSDGQVVSMSGETVSAADDPSADYSTYSLSSTAESFTLPENKLFNMNFGTIYTVDIYFYLEGCDSDCVTSICLDEVDLQLSFYGVLQS